MTKWCTGYCDTRCERPEGHEGGCSDGYEYWRDLTDEEAEAFKAEQKAARKEVMPA